MLVDRQSYSCRNRYTKIRPRDVSKRSHKYVDGIAFQNLCMLYEYLKSHKFDKIENCLIIKLSSSYTAHIIQKTYVVF